MPGHIDDQTIESFRAINASIEFDNYDFSMTVSDAGGWEETEANRLSRKVYADDGGSRERLIFHVVFYPGAATPKEAFAYRLHDGAQIGNQTWEDIPL